MVVHELGHVLGCLASGARIEAVVLWPWRISQTVRSDSSTPLVDTWAGPVLGALLPLAVYGLVRWRGHRGRGREMTGFFAGFCLIANGLYLGLGWMDRAGDAGDLLRLGAPVGALIGFGVAAVSGGLWVWNGELFRDGRA